MTILISKLQTLLTSGNGSSYSMLSVTPAPKSLLVAVVHAPGTVLLPWVVNGAGSTAGWVRRSTRTFNTKDSSANAFIVFTAWQEADPVALTPVFTCNGDPATGCLIALFQITGLNSAFDPETQAPGANTIAAMTYAGTVGGADANVGDNTPDPVVYPGKFSDGGMRASANPNNAYLMAIASHRNPAGYTPPSGWTEQVDSGINGPAAGLWIGTKVGGETASEFTVVGASCNWAAHYMEFCAPGELPS